MIKMTYLGHKAKYFDTIEDVHRFIKKVLKKYEDLNPREIYRYENIEYDLKTTIVIYKCSKFYTMIFKIEESI